MLPDLLLLIFPRVCQSCGKTCTGREKTLCTFCIHSLPRTNFHLSPGNPVEKMFLGRIPLSSATSFFEFSEKGKVQRLIHNFKYRGQPQIGEEVGRLFAAEAGRSGFFKGMDFIVPVPLHPAKLKRRGYNQSLLFARGIAGVTQLPVLDHVLERSRASATQTVRSRYERWKNVETIFILKNLPGLQNSHILLVDDVVTTGATLEACALQLAKISGVKISVAAIAYARL